MGAEAPTSRRRARVVVVVVTFAVVAVAAGGWAVWGAGGLPGRPAAAAVPEVPTGTAAVKRTDVVQRQQVTGTLGFEGGFTVVGQAAGGTLTRLPAPGTVLTRGRAVYEVDGAGVPLWYGARPAWRELRLGMPDGPDVRQLEGNLVALGFDPDRRVSVDAHFSRATAAAVRRWQRAGGRPRTGAVALGQVVFLPGPIRVTSVGATLGAPVEPGAPVLAVSSTRPVVTVALNPAFQQLVRRGNRVEVFLPDGATTPGTVTGIGRAAVLSDPQGDGQDGGQGGGPEQATITVTVGLAEPRAVRGLDQAPVQVAIVSQARRGVLAVPIAALLAQPGGGYAVQVVGGTGGGRVPVRAGLFDERAGLVEVGGPGLAEGTRVEVPAQ
jgi:peptidoglycan hydrolase-like protein with peptidoglycan-binding domain